MLWIDRLAGVRRFALKTIVATAAALSVLALLGAKPAAARPPLPWCVEFDNGGDVICAYYTHRQCLETASGVGPCVRNSAFDWYYHQRGQVAPVDVDPYGRQPRRRRK